MFFPPSLRLQEFLYYNQIYTLNQRIVAIKHVVNVKLHLIVRINLNDVSQICC